MTLDERERQEMDEDPLKKLNKARTKRLEKGFLAMINNEDSIEDKEFDPGLKAVEDFLRN